MIKFWDFHFNITFRANKRIDIEGIEHLSFVPGKIWRNSRSFKSFHSFSEFLWFSSGIKPKSADHFKVFRRQMNKDLSNKFGQRHGNKCFLFIEFKIIKKERNRIMRNRRNFVFSNRSSCKIAAEIFNDTLIVVNMTVTNIKEESFINFVQKIDSIFSL